MGWDGLNGRMAVSLRRRRETRVVGFHAIRCGPYAYRRVHDKRTQLHGSAKWRRNDNSLLLYTTHYRCLVEMIVH